MNDLLIMFKRIICHFKGHVPTLVERYETRQGVKLSGSFEMPTKETSRVTKGKIACKRCKTVYLGETWN